MPHTDTGRTTDPGGDTSLDGFEMLIDEPYLSLVYYQGSYLGDILLDKTKPDTALQAQLEGIFLTIAQGYSLYPEEYAISASGWVSVQFLPLEEN